MNTGDMGSWKRWRLRKGELMENMSRRQGGMGSRDDFMMIMRVLDFVTVFRALF